MEHSLGELRARFWLLRWRNVALHAPFRYYYIFRNTLLLGKKKYIKASSKIGLYKQLLMLSIYLLTIAPNRRANYSMMLRGLVDGIRGISGPLLTNQKLEK